MSASIFLQLAGFALTVLLAAGVLWAWPRVRSRAVSDVQNRVITLQKQEIDAQNLRIESLTAKVARLEGTLATVRYMLKRQGTEVIIEDDYVTLRTTPMGKSTTIRVRRETVQQAIDKLPDISIDPTSDEGGATGSSDHDPSI